MLHLPCQYHFTGFYKNNILVINYCAFCGSVLWGEKVTHGPSDITKITCYRKLLTDRTPNQHYKRTNNEKKTPKIQLPLRKQSVSVTHFVEIPFPSKAETRDR